MVIHPFSWLDSDVQNYRIDQSLGGGDVNGTLQQYMVTDDARVIRAPKNWSVEESAGLVTAGGTAMNALACGPMKLAEGMTLLTQGTGV